MIVKSKQWCPMSICAFPILDSLALDGAWTVSTSGLSSGAVSSLSSADLADTVTFSHYVDVKLGSTNRVDWRVNGAPYTAFVPAGHHATADFCSAMESAMTAQDGLDKVVNIFRTINGDRRVSIKSSGVTTRFELQPDGPNSVLLTLGYDIASDYRAFPDGNGDATLFADGIVTEAPAWIRFNAAVPGAVVFVGYCGSFESSLMGTRRPRRVSMRLYSNGADLGEQFNDWATGATLHYSLPIEANDTVSPIRGMLFVPPDPPPTAEHFLVSFHDSHDIGLSWFGLGNALFMQSSATPTYSSIPHGLKPPADRIPVNVLSAYSGIFGAARTATGIPSGMAAPESRFDLFRIQYSGAGDFAAAQTGAVAEQLSAGISTGPAVITARPLSGKQGLHGNLLCDTLTSPSVAFGYLAGGDIDIATDPATGNSKTVVVDMLRHIPIHKRSDRL